VPPPPPPPPSKQVDDDDLGDFASSDEELDNDLDDLLDGNTKGKIQQEKKGVGIKKKNEKKEEVKISVSDSGDDDDLADFASSDEDVGDDTCNSR